MRLPPFDALIAFDAVLRHGGMTRAAAELGVTQSAISHRVRRLEAFMGAPLLRRHAGGLTPTPAGEALAEGLAGALAEMAGLRARCLAAVGPSRLRLGVGAALAHNWLVRRLPDFAARSPSLSIELVIVENEAPELVSDLDLRILWVPAAELRATTTQRPLFQERVFPVCHPSLLPAGHVPGDPSVLVDLPLLHKGPAGRATSAEWSWAAWLERYRLPAKPKESFRFASIGPAIAAALEGAGVVLARSMLVHDALADGRLVRILPPEEDLASSKAHVVRWPGALRSDERVRSLASWLLEQAELTVRGDTIAGRQAALSSP
ncbi:LysR substrate-binding domain-containing protein [Phenylobacterium terrae]|uniref:LysR substrate-binding domain-containing protein n=1 Tax=Phenylobacterium terrae TaxID=2665495 RepID=A0ABW4N646_9CAUL